MLTIDGSYGEGGGQILRTTVSLAAITGAAVQIVNIRANRSKPGLRPQHLTAVQAAARLCNAQVEGAALDSQTLVFAPQSPPQPGVYVFDVRDATTRGSAGAATLVLQTVLLPLALASGPSTVTVHGGTHVPMSPPALFVEKVYLPTLFDMGVKTRLTQHEWGLMPQGGGALTVEIAGGAALRPLDLTERGAPQDVLGIAFVSNLPSHIPQRMSSRARSVLHQAGLPRITVDPCHVTAEDMAAGIFLLARYENTVAGFDMLGRKSLSSEKVAEAACHTLLDYHRSGAAVEMHLADQLVLPCGLAPGVSRLTVSRISQHLLTNLWVTAQFGLAEAQVEGDEGQPVMVTIQRR